MKIKLTAGFLRSIKDEQELNLMTMRLDKMTIKNLTQKKRPDFFNNSKMVANESYLPDDNVIEIEIAEYGPQQLIDVRSILNKYDASDRVLEQVARWVQMLKSPLAATISTLPEMHKIFSQLCSVSIDRWFLIEMPDGMLVPFVCTEFAYNRAKRFEEPSFTMEFQCGFFFKGGKRRYYWDDEDEDESDDSYEAGHSIMTQRFTWWDYHLEIATKSPDEDIVEDVDITVFTDKVSPDELSEDDDEYDDEEESNKKLTKRKKPKREKKSRTTMANLLTSKGILWFDDVTRAKYVQQMIRYQKAAVQIGKQYTCVDTALIPKESWRDDMDLKKVRMFEEGRKFRMVVDQDTLGLDSAPRTVSESGTTFSLPYAPYVRMFDITKHRTVAVHIDKMEEYQYNHNLVNDLILHKDHKDMLSSLINGENTFSDIVSGKSGGMIILASGPAGTGKTATAETYTERVEKALYSVQSTELGLKIDTIEKNLALVLRRAERWNAVLLIDECDTYVYKRGSDMMQNAIIGVFLRLLEYFNGLMFMTTNRHDIIDEAVMSRVTAHFKYGIPTPELAPDILKVLCRTLDVKVSDAEAKKFAAQYPNMTGRDMRNMLKLVKKRYHNGKQIELKVDMIKPIAAFIPFLKEDSDEKQAK